MLDNDKLKENLDVAIDAYISRVDGTPCGDTVIHLHKGAIDSEQVKYRSNLLTFLKGSNKAKLALKQREPEQYAFFQKVWDLRSRHMVSELPIQYAFMLTCCYQSDCCHPECKNGKPSSIHRWYDGGPTINMLPLPVVDEKRPWGSACEHCINCSGHYKTVLTDVRDKAAMHSVALPPSAILKEEFSKAKKPVDDKFVEEAAKKALLSTDDARIWLEHLQVVLNNRKRGAKKAAATRARNSVLNLVDNSREDTEYYCGMCGKQYIEETDTEELWIACDMCDSWYCAVCENVTVIPTDAYICSKCCS